MSSDSSSEEEIDHLREAVDGDFLTDSLYRNSFIEKHHEIENKKSKQLPSLRNQTKSTESLNPFSIKVTPEFQKHVARHLSKILDESLDDSEKFPRIKKLKKKRYSYSEIKLLNKSKGFLVSDYNEVNMPHTYRKHEESDDSDREKKAKEVAVTGEWVLSQQETKSWSQNIKGEVEVVKLNLINKEMFRRKNRKRKNKKLLT